MIHKESLVSVFSYKTQSLEILRMNDFIWWIDFFLLFKVPTNIFGTALFVSLFVQKTFFLN